MATPSVSRPFEMTSTIAASSAALTGWWNGSTTTSVPSLMRLVFAANPASTSSGEGQ